MPDPIVTGAAITAGAQLLGGALSNSKQVDPTTSAAYWHTMANNNRMQRQFAKQGVRWRVADAKAAGLHPVYALSGSLPGYQPSQLVGSSGEDRDAVAMAEAFSNAGQAVGRAVGAQQTAHERRMEYLKEEAIRAAIMKDHAATAASLSETARRRQAALSSMPFPSSAVGESPGDTVIRSAVESSPMVADVVQLKAPEQVSRNSSHPQMTAALNPGLMEERLSPWLTISAPRNEEGWSEGLESMPWWMVPGLAAENTRIHGSQWPRKMLQWLFMQNPTPMPPAIPPSTGPQSSSEWWSRWWRRLWNDERAPRPSRLK